MNYRYFLLLFLTFNICQYTFSQKKLRPAFIILNESDTIYGQAFVNNLQDYCFFKKDSSETKTKYLASDIRTLKFLNGKYYVSKEIQEQNGKTKCYLLEFLVEGEIDLYVIAYSKRFFIMKENEKFVELKDNIKKVKYSDGLNYMVKDKKYVGYLRASMSEAPELFPEINKMETINQRDLIKLSTKYHNAVCNEYECIDYSKNIPKVVYKIEVVTGVTHHNPGYAAHTGVLLRMSNPIKNENLYLKTGILFSDKPLFNANFRHSTWSRNFKIPISLEYVFGKKPFRPTLAAGFPTGIFLLSSVQGGFLYSLNEKFELGTSASVDGLLVLALGKHKETFNNNFGHTINIGIVYRLN